METEKKVEEMTDVEVMDELKELIAAMSYEDKILILAKMIGMKRGEGETESENKAEAEVEVEATSTREEDIIALLKCLEKCDLIYVGELRRRVERRNSPSELSPAFKLAANWLRARPYETKLAVVLTDELTRHDETIGNYILTEFAREVDAQVGKLGDITGALSAVAATLMPLDV